MIIGIDPGLTGALALVDDQNAFQLVQDHYAMPIMTKAFGKGMQIDAGQLSVILSEWKLTYPIKLCRIERVGPMPKQGVTSVFSFGYSLGVVVGVVATLGIPIEWCRPQEWKKQYGLIKAPKDASRGVVSELYPKMREAMKPKKAHGIADAILIASYH